MKLQIGIDGKTYELEVEVTEEDNGTHRAPVSSYSPPTTVPSVPAAGAAAAPGAPAEEGDVNEGKVSRSPVAGVVIRINAQVGQQLQANDLIMVIEAMKMETNVTAPADGKVKSIRVAKGDGVKVKQVLVEFE